MLHVLSLSRLRINVCVSSKDHRQWLQERPPQSRKGNLLFQSQHVHPNCQPILTIYCRSNTFRDAETRSQESLAVHPSTCGSASDKHAPSQQRNYTNPTFGTTTIAHTQHATTTATRREPPRPLVASSSTSRTNKIHDDLSGVGAQMSDTGRPHYEIQTPTARMEAALACPYHGPRLREPLVDRCSGRGLSPMDRYLAEGRAERGAVFRLEELGLRSGCEGCDCFGMM